MRPYQIIHIESLKANLMNNPEVIKEMILLYLGQGKKDFDQLVRAVSEDNREEIRRMAHHIKPTMQYIGALDLQNKFLQLEELVKAERTPAEIQQHFSLLKKDFNLAMEELEDYRACIS